MKQLNLNREFRTRSFVFRFHLVWVAFYDVLLIMIAGFIGYLYHEHSEDQLPAGHVELTVSKTSYQPGEVVQFSIKNNFPTTIYTTNRCPEEPLDVYTWQDDNWHQIHDTAVQGQADCFTQPRNVALKAGQTITYSFKDWPHLFANPGVYRIVLHIDHYNDLPFQDFKVLEAPQAQRQPSSSSSPSTNTSTTPDQASPQSTSEQQENHNETNALPERGDD